MSLEENVFIFTEAEQFENSYVYTNVTFVKDFGPWSKDSTFQSMSLNMDAGVLAEHAEDGSIIKEQRVGLCVLTN